jgi:type IV pilus assembly protein PilA
MIMFKKKGFTLVELMVVVLIVGILAAVAIPILRGRIDSAKWTEGKAMVGSIGTALRAYGAEKGPTGTAPTTLTQIGFAAGDLGGTYFADGNFSFTVSAMDPLAYTITVTAPAGISSPSQIVLDQAGTWTETP